MLFEDFLLAFEKKQVVHFKKWVLEKPKISICVQTYNHEKFISKCLESILSQKTDFDFEILLGEDNSSDNTREICIFYANKYPEKVRLFLHNRENNISINKKPTGRFNFLYNLYQAKGEFIALCEGDDYWIDENKLSKQVKFLEENKKYVGCFTNFRIVDEYEKIIEYSGINLQHSELNQIEILKRTTPKTLTTVFKREALPISIPTFLTSGLNGDLLVNALLAEKKPFKYLDEITGAYRVHSGGIWSLSSQTSRYKSQINTVFHMLGYFKKQEQIDALSHRMGAAFKGLIRLNKNEKNVITAKYYRLIYYIFDNIYIPFLKKVYSLLK